MTKPAVVLFLAFLFLVAAAAYLVFIILVTVQVVTVDVETKMVISHVFLLIVILQLAFTMWLAYNRSKQ